MIHTWNFLTKTESIYGDSFYIFDIDTFKFNYNKLLNAFRQFYPRSSIGYSYKTNYIPLLCKTVDEIGGYAEVVSNMEYELAIRLGVNPNRIIFNGPLKKKEDLKKALINRSMVNIDSLKELEHIISISEEHPNHQFSIGIRCNFSIDETKQSRFGIENIKDAFEIIDKIKNCNINGLHCHASFIRSPSSFQLRAKKLINLAKIYCDPITLEYIDIGGGFFGDMPRYLSKQFKEAVPSFSEYAESTAKYFADELAASTFQPELIIEPGVGLVANTMQFICKVIDIKKIGKKQYVLVTGSIQNIKPFSNSIQLPVTVVTENIEPSDPEKFFPKDIVGYTCMENDILISDYQGNIHIDDFIIFDSVGAYTVVFKPPFIRPAPPILVKDRTGVYAARHKECGSDIFSTYEFNF